MASPYISVLAFNEQFDLPNLNLNLSDASTYPIGGGAANVVALNFTVYVGGTSGILLYQNTSLVTPDIVPSAPVTKTIKIPTFRNQAQWGTYTVIATATDNLGNVVTTTTIFNLCQPQSCGCGCGCTTNTNGSCASVSVKFDCNQATVYVLDTTAFLYQGVQGNPTYSMTINYPLASGISPCNSIG